MVQEVRLRLSSTDHHKLEEVCERIKKVVEETGAQMSGPIPLPTKRLLVPTRKSPDGEGKATWDKWEMRVHKRLIDIKGDERTIRRLMRIHIPEEVHVEIIMK
ncbi:30S ribosomal protein S10 [Methanopyrus sp.]